MSVFPACALPDRTNFIFAALKTAHELTVRDSVDDLSGIDRLCSPDHVPFDVTDAALGPTLPGLPESSEQGAGPKTVA